MYTDVDEQKLSYIHDVLMLMAREDVIYIRTYVHMHVS
jgi:hypothetical protein